MVVNAVCYINKLYYIILSVLLALGFIIFSVSICLRMYDAFITMIKHHLLQSVNLTLGMLETNRRFQPFLNRLKTNRKN